MESSHDCEYSHKLLVNGQVKADEFPDWHAIMTIDRCAIFKQPISDNLSQNSTVNHTAFSAETEIDSRGSHTFNSQNTASPITNTSTINVPLSTERMDTTISTGERDITPTQASPSILRPPTLSFGTVGNNTGATQQRQCNSRPSDPILTSTPTATGYGNRPRADHQSNNGNTQ